MQSTLYDTFWRRLLALLLDDVIAMVGGIMIILPVVLITGLKRWSPIMFGVVMSSFVSGYFILMTSWGGQTVGKMAVGVRVVNLDGSPVGLEQATLRYLPRLFLGLLISAVMVVWMWDASVDNPISPESVPQYPMFISGAWGLAEFLSVVATGKSRAIHDFIADTVVERVQPK